MTFERFGFNFQRKNCFAGLIFQRQEELVKQGKCFVPEKVIQKSGKHIDADHL
jgi:hypothetical protein